VRVSFSSLLRVKYDDSYVLFHAQFRPGSFGPPGGVYKYFDPAVRILEGLGFEEDHPGRFIDVTRYDIRGFLPAGSVRGFLRWFASGCYREDAVECLHRELVEELVEVGVPELVDDVPGLTFTHLRSVVEGPGPAPGRNYRQLRRFDVCELVMVDGRANRFRRRLLDAGADPGTPFVLCANASDIRHGRVGDVLIAPQTAFLIGRSRIFQDLPPAR
jgi:hypothetical protein